MGTLLFKNTEKNGHACANWLALYNQLQQSIKACEASEKDALKQIEFCFMTVISVLTKLSEEIIASGFESQKEEIFFFKIVKPLFTSQLQYYKLMYNAMLFTDTIKDPVEQEFFWSKQTALLQTFKEKNAGFYTYYLQGKTNNDQDWFTKKPLVDMDCRLNSSHDKLVAQLIALKKIRRYANTHFQR